MEQGQPGARDPVRERWNGCQAAPGQFKSSGQVQRFLSGHNQIDNLFHLCRDHVRELFAYDLVGFQTETDVQAFGDYVEREAGGWIGDDGIMHAFGTSVRAGSFPISIDTRAVAVRAARAMRTRQAGRLRESLAGRQLVIGSDGLLCRTISSWSVIASSLVRQQHVGWFAGASLRGDHGFLAISPPPGHAPGDGPNKASQLAGDRGCDDIGLLAVAGELSMARRAAAVAPVNRKLALALVGFYAFDVIILLSSARIGISSRSSALRRVQSIPVGAALGRLMRIAWVGVAITLSG